MIEVEIRAKIDCREDVIRNVLDIGARYIESKEQQDWVFGHPGSLDSNHHIIEGHFSGRIREEDGRVSLEFKEIRRQKAGIEISSVVSKTEFALAFLERIGYKEAFRVSKVRDKFVYGEFNICVDKVEGLGDFIEVEIMLEDKVGEDLAREKCVDLLRLISGSFVIEDRKYGDLMQEKINGKQV